MSEPLLYGKTGFQARALLFGSRLDLRALEEANSLALNPLTVDIEGGIAVLYRFGAVVLFGVDPIHEAVILKRLSALTSDPLLLPELEDVSVQIDPNVREGMRGSTAFLKEINVERLQVIADVLAKSVVLAHYEAQVDENIERIEPLARDLKLHGKISGNAKDMLRHIGTMLWSEYVMVGRVNVHEKPEVLWENPELEGFFIRIEDEFEIIERHTALERKLKLISQTAESLLNVLNSRHSMRLEWYIIILIAAEILLMLYELFLY